MSNYQHIIADLTLITGSKGIFDVRVNGEMLYSKHATGRHAEDGEVLALFKKLVGSDVLIYGT
jgi:selenoprotein W-related protein